MAFNWKASCVGEGAASAKQVFPAAERNKAAILEALRPRLPPSGLVLEAASGTGQHVAHFAENLSPGLIWQPTDLTPDLFPSIASHCAHLPNVRPPKVLDTSSDPWPQLLGIAHPTHPSTSASAIADGAKPQSSGSCPTPEAGSSGQQQQQQQGEEEQEKEEEAPADRQQQQQLTPLQLQAVYVANLTHIAPWAATAGLLRGCGTWLVPGGVLLLYGPFKINGKCTTDSNAEFDAQLRGSNPAWGYRDVQSEVEPAAVAAGLALEEVVPMPANNFFLVLRKQEPPPPPQ